jgi:Arc/MetJ family transcription regulator
MTSIDIPDELMAEVLELTGQKTKRGAVILSLEEAARRRRQKRALERMFTLDFMSDLLDPEVRAKARG